MRVRGVSPRPTFSWGSKSRPASGSEHAELPGDAVHRFRKLDVEAGDAAGVVRRQHHLHGLVDIAPFRVMVVLLGDQRGAGHEAKGLVEILEGEGALDRLAAGRLFPARQLRQRRLPRLRRQPLRHACLLFHGNFTLTPTERLRSMPQSPFRGGTVTMTGTRRAAMTKFC